MFPLLALIVAGISLTCLLVKWKTPVAKCSIAILPNHAPWGLDRIEQILRAEQESRLMDLFLFHFQRCGVTMEHRFLGSVAIGTIEPANVAALLSSGSSVWSVSTRACVIRRVLGPGIFTQEGSAWKSNRRLLKSYLTQRSRSNMDQCREFVDQMLARIPRDTEVDLQPHFFQLALDTAIGWIFGPASGSFDSARRRDFARDFDILQETIVRQLRLPFLRWLPLSGQAVRAQKGVAGFIDELIEKAICQGDDQEMGYIHILHDIEPDRCALRGQVLHLLVAGRDTTACLLSWAVFLLIRHEKCLTKLKATVSSHEPAGLWYEGLAGNDYLQHVISETLRRYPPIPVDMRCAQEDTFLPKDGGLGGGNPLFIKKGTDVSFCVYAMHRRPDLFGMDAALFSPERWEQLMPFQKHPVSAQWGFLPFGGGSRACLGSKFAIATASYTLTKLLRELPNISLPENANITLLGAEKQALRLSLSIEEGCNVKT